MTPDALAPLVFLAAALLVLAGGVKLVRPRATAQAMLDAGLPGSRAVARGIGAVEIARAPGRLPRRPQGARVALGGGLPRVRGVPRLRAAHASRRRLVRLRGRDARAAEPPAPGAELVAARGRLRVRDRPQRRVRRRGVAALGWAERVPVARRARASPAGSRWSPSTEAPAAWRSWEPPAHQSTTPQPPRPRSRRRRRGRSRRAGHRPRAPEPVARRGAGGVAG